MKRIMVFGGLMILYLVEFIGITAVAASQSDTVVDVASFRPLVQDCLNTIAELISEREKEHGETLRPFVTLSYAQSLDGKIAINVESLQGGPTTSSNLPISGSESLYLTHALRSQHDAILIGGKTLAMDNPRLNNRLWVTEALQHQQPRPVVLDPNLRYLLELGDSLRAKKLIVCCTKEAALINPNIPHSVTLLECPVTSDQRLDLMYILSKLRQSFGIKSVMVEGGASVLTAFANEGLVNFQCVTIAPKLLGAGGLASISNLQSKTSHQESSGISLGPLHCFNLGPDCIVLTKWQ